MFQQEAKVPRRLFAEKTEVEIRLFLPEKSLINEILNFFLDRN